MSTFNGLITEIPQISIDNFETKGMKFYFLSHCHSDHLKDIENFDEESPLYATPISKLIVSKKYPKINAIELDIGTSKNLEVANSDGSSLPFIVTPLSAGHCMGACMFLFQIEGTDILYTGDFRMSIDDAKKIKHLRDIVGYGNLVLYFDSTFFSPTYEKFPKLKDSIEKTIEIADKHLKACSSHKGIKENLSGRFKGGFKF